MTDILTNNPEQQQSPLTNDDEEEFSPQNTIDELQITTDNFNKDDRPNSVDSDGTVNLINQSAYPDRLDEEQIPTAINIDYDILFSKNIYAESLSTHMSESTLKEFNYLVNCLGEIVSLEYFIVDESICRQLDERTDEHNITENMKDSVIFGLEQNKLVNIDGCQNLKTLYHKYYVIYAVLTLLLNRLNLICINILGGNDSKFFLEKFLKITTLAAVRSSEIFSFLLFLSDGSYFDFTVNFLKVLEVEFFTRDSSVNGEEKLVFEEYVDVLPNCLKLLNSCSIEDFNIDINFILFRVLILFSGISYNNEKINYYFNYIYKEKDMTPPLNSIHDSDYEAICRLDIHSGGSHIEGISLEQGASIAIEMGEPALSDNLLECLSVEEAIAIVLRNDRGRFGITKTKMLRDFMSSGEKTEEVMDGSVTHVPINDSAMAVTYIAACWKSKVCRRNYIQKRNEEYDFLRILPRPAPIVKQQFKLPLKLTSVIDHVSLPNMHKTTNRPSVFSAEFYANASIKINSYLHFSASEHVEIKDRLIATSLPTMIKERRDFYLKYFLDYSGKYPTNIDEFYLSEEERAELLRIAEEQAAAADDKKGKGSDKGKKDSKGKAEAGPPKVYLLGTTPTVNELSKSLKASDTNDSPNIDIIKEIEAMADEVINNELTKLNESGKKKKKEKGSKGKKAKGKGKAGKKWTSAVGTVRVIDDCLPEFIENGIIKRVSFTHEEITMTNSLDCFVETPIHSTELTSGNRYSPSISLIHNNALFHNSLSRNLFLNRDKFDTKRLSQLLPVSFFESLSNDFIPSYSTTSILLYGPRGNGKSLMIEKIISSVNFVHPYIIDLSPLNLANKYLLPTKASGSSALMYKTFLILSECLKSNGPMIILVKNVDLIFLKKINATNSSAINLPIDYLNTSVCPSRFKKDFIALIKQLRTLKGVLLIGTMSNPNSELITDKDFIACFDQKLYLSNPNEIDRKTLVNRYVLSSNVNGVDGSVIPDDFINITSGFSRSSIIRVLDSVLTERRVLLKRRKPILISEFIGILAADKNALMFKEDADIWRNIDYVFSGEKAIREKREKAANGDTGGGDKKKKKK